MSEHEQHWSRTRERGNVFWLALSIKTYRWLGKPVALLIAYGVTIYFFLTGATARAASRDYLQRLFVWSRGSTPPPNLRNTASNFFAFADSIVDSFGCWFGDIAPEDCDMPGKNAFLEQAHTGRGAVLLSSHIGNVEVASRMAEAAEGVYLNILVHTKHAVAINELLNSVAQRKFCRFIQVDEFNVGTAIYLHEKIERGEWVVIAGDRTPVTGNQHINVLPFLGGSAAFAQGPFILAALLECPVYTIFCVRSSGRRYHVLLDKLSDSLKSNRRERALIIMAAQQRYVETLEGIVLRYPLQWFNFFDFWLQPVSAGNEGKHE
jgi:predicted LPLAT superfamily acyltransferase